MYFSHFSVPQTPQHLGLHQTSSQPRWPDSIELANLAPDSSPKEHIDLLTRFDRIRRLSIFRRLRSSGHSVSAFVFCSTASGRDKILAEKNLQIGGSFAEVSHTTQRDYATITRMETANRKVFIRGLQSETSEVTLSNYFSRFGEVENVEIPRNHIDKTSRRIAFVTFGSEEEALNCLSCKDHKLQGKSITCRPYQEKPCVDDRESGSSSSHRLNIASLSRTGVHSSPLFESQVQTSSSPQQQRVDGSRKCGTRAESAGSAQNTHLFDRSSMTRITSGSRIGSVCTECQSSGAFLTPGDDAARDLNSAREGWLRHLEPEESDSCLPSNPSFSTRKVHVSFFTVPGFF